MKSFLVLLLILLPCFNNLHAGSHITLNKNLGIVIGKNVRVRTGPSTSSRIITSLNSGDLVMIMDRTKKSIQLIKSRIFYYYWHRIEYKKGKTGWIYGQFLYRYNSEVNNKLLNKISFNNRIYRVLQFDEQCDLDALKEAPMQDRYAVPCMYDVETNTVRFFGFSKNLDKKIEYDTSRSSRLFNRIFLFMRNFGFYEDIEKAAWKKGSSIVLPVVTGLQEGRATFQLKIKKKTGNFHIVDIMNYKRDYDYRD